MTRSRDSSFWQTTCSAIRAGAPLGWSEVTDYREPLLAFLGARFGWLAEQEREDLVHDLLLELRGRLGERYRPDRGRFRAYLTGVCRNRVLAAWRRRRRTVPLEEGPEPVGEPDEVDGAAIDLVSQLIAAIRRWHDRQTDPARVYVLAGRLVRRETLREIARRESLSVDAVRRILQAARREIVEDLLRRTVCASAVGGLDWQRLTGLVFRAIAEPRRAVRILEEVGVAQLREGLLAWVDALQRAKEHLRDAGGVDAGALREGLEEILGRG